MDTPDTAQQYRYALLLREIDALRADAGTTAVALVLIQLDGLGEINRRFGFLAGDRVLAEFAGRMAGVGREQDRVVPVHGTRFALVIHNPLHEGHAVLGADKVARVAAEPFMIGGQRARVRVRMGISLLPQPARGADELLAQCEIALRAARTRDEAYMVYTDGLCAAAGAPTHAWFDIEQALQQGEFAMHFQPKVELRSGALYGAEALVRWNNPEVGQLSPGSFIAAIEQTQEIRALLWFALNASLRQSSGWLARCPDFRVAVNVATGNLEDSDLVALTADALKVWSFPPEQLVLEVTESALMRDTRAAVEVLSALRGLGVRVSIDDFGTGYSSLAWLKSLPADELKIDRSFITGIADDETDRRIVESVISLGHAVQLKVVAEGIETEAVRDTLVALGCDIGQGYLYSPPLPPESFGEQWIDVPR